MTEPAPPELPPRYYLDHFETLLAHVERLYPDLLSPDESGFIEVFHSLPEPARCLYVRLVNRRPDFFRVARLGYPEIVDRDMALAELERVSLIEPLAERHVPELAALLALFSLDELRRLASSLPAGSSKAERIARLVADRGAALIGAIDEPVIRRLGMDRVRVLKLLFFGSLHRDMDQFVIRDLGHARFEAVDADRLTPYFRTRAQVDAKVVIHAAAERFAELRKLDAASVAGWYRDWHAGFGEPDPLVEPSLDRLTLKVARHVERSGLPEAALALYALTARPPARERRVRLLAGLGRTDEAVALCERITADPVHAAEAGFARDWLARRAGERRRAATRMLAGADTITLDARWRPCVEQGVLDWYRARGWQGLFSENQPWRGLFGLLFWDLLFDPQAGVIHHPLQRAPSDLFRPEFYPRRREAIEDRLRMLDDPATLRSRLAATIERKRGISNPLVVWSESLPVLIERCCTLLRPAQLRAVLDCMARDLPANGSGFPDLLVWNERDYCFVEVKSPTDQLAEQQRCWLERFEALEIAAHLLRVGWAEGSGVEE